MEDQNTVILMSNKGEEEINANELIKVNYGSEQPTVSGRDLYQALEVKTPYMKWFNRMTEYGFTQGVDYEILVGQKSLTNNPKNPVTSITDHEITIPMAKELCMIQRNEKGKLFRQYFIEIEEAWNSPEMIMNRALKMSQSRIEMLKGNIQQLQIENKEMLPKAEYYDSLVENNHLTNFRETAKELGMNQKDFMKYLRDKKYIYTSARGNILPYANKNKGYFETKDFWNSLNGAVGTQTLITVKGKNKFREEMRT